MDQQEIAEQDAPRSWEDLPQNVKDFAGDALDEDTKLKSKFFVRQSGLVEFSMRFQTDFGKVTVSDEVEGEIEPQAKRIVVRHETEQMAGVVEENDPEAGGGGSLMSIPEYHKWGIVYNGGGKDSSIYVVAKDWQMGIGVDANGIVDLPEEKKKQMEDHFGSSLGLSNGLKIDLVATTKSISKPLKSEDVIGSYTLKPTLETGLPIPQIPVVLTKI